MANTDKADGKQENDRRVERVGVLQDCRSVGCDKGLLVRAAISTRGACYC